MARAATKWAYKTDFTKSCPDMTAPALALLRALCYKVDPADGKTREKLSDADLMRLTGYKTPSKIVEARKLLKKHDLIAHDPMDEDKHEYQYFVRYRKAWEFYHLDF